MTYINASDFGIIPESEVTAKIIELCSFIRSIPGKKTLVFEKGTYYIDSEKCEKRMLFITNTAGDEEYEKDETPHLNKFAFCLEGVSELTVEGNGCIFVIDGKASNLCLIGCENVEIKNLEFRHAHPDMHELKVLEKSRFSVTFALDKDSLYSFEKGKLYFYGNNYRVNAKKGAKTACYIGHIRKETPDTVKRVRHPLANAFKIKAEDEGKIKVFYPVTKSFSEGDRFYIYDVRRQFVGIFVEGSKNIEFKNIRQRFNYSLALVAQDSENITVDSVDFSPEKDGARMLASCADFMQFCMCRGKLTVKNSRFEGAADDCINVHGIHFKITQINDNNIKVRFMHPQTHGFNPIRMGDEIAFINPDTLLETARAKVIASELLNEREILLTLDSTKNAKLGQVIENVTACPEVTFCNNLVSRIITRGVLVTTRGKVVIKDNHFVSTSMSGILISDDARSWFESGMCLDVSIENNVFDYCGETPILIKPEIKKNEGAVHKNIRITGNHFKNYHGEPIEVSGAGNVVIEG